VDRGGAKQMQEPYLISQPFPKAINSVVFGIHFFQLLGDSIF
jgi:hypothetical protein